jgi:hypothetical protein
MEPSGDDDGAFAALRVALALVEFAGKMLLGMFGFAVATVVAAEIERHASLHDGNTQSTVSYCKIYWRRGGDSNPR